MKDRNGTELKFGDYVILQGKIEYITSSSEGEVFVNISGVSKEQRLLPEVLEKVSTSIPHHPAHTWFVLEGGADKLRMFTFIAPEPHCYKEEKGQWVEEPMSNFTSDSFWQTLALCMLNVPHSGVFISQTAQPSVGQARRLFGNRL